MNKLTMRDRIILCVLAAVIGIYGVFNFVCTPISSSIKSLKEEKAVLKTTLTDKYGADKRLKELGADNEELVKKISDIKKSETAKTLTKEEFLVFLTDSANKSNAKVIKFNELGVDNENGIWKETFDFEIRGTLANINAVCSRIDLMGIRYSIGSMSLRQDKKYPYLERKFDEFSNLKWYSDPIKPKEEADETPTNEQPLTDVPQEPFVIEPFIPDIAPTPVPEIPQEQAPLWEEPTPTPDPTPTPPNTNNGNINDRLNELLKPTSYSKSGYKVVFLTNSTFSGDTSEYDSGEIMTLSVTIQLIMYQEPKPGASVVITEEDSGNDVL